MLADVGNSRLKWALADDHAILRTFTLPLDDAEQWSEVARGVVSHGIKWVVAGSNTPVLEGLMAWVDRMGWEVRRIHTYQQLPLTMDVDHPETVGLDRLFNAVAATEALQRARHAIIVDAGSAITINVMRAGGVFAGGAIFPGLRLMAQSLHDYTAALPLVEVTIPSPPVPGRATVPAMIAGTYGAAVGGIQYLVEQLQRSLQGQAACFLTGGDSNLLAPALSTNFKLWPTMTLEGIRLTAVRLP